MRTSLPRPRLLGKGDQPPVEVGRLICQTVIFELCRLAPKVGPESPESPASTKRAAANATASRMVERPLLHAHAGGHSAG